MLSMSYRDLVKHMSGSFGSTLFPMIFATHNFREWQVVADAADVAGQSHAGRIADEPTHISAPDIIANLKPFGCIDNEIGETDPFMNHFPTLEKARAYKWKLVEHVSIHGSVSLVACVMRGMDEVNEVIEHYARHCARGSVLGAELKCTFSPNAHHCIDGQIDPKIFEGLTHRRVRIKTVP